MTATRFGFFFWPFSPEYTAQMARRGDEGWDLVGIADTPGNALDPWVAMTVAASCTRRVPLATCVTNLVTRHPAMTAWAAASADRVAGGRVILGVGAGHSGVANLGERPAGPETLREGVTFLRHALSGEPATYRGVPFQLPALAGAPASAGRQRVPVYLAASGPRALRAAGAVADGAFVNYGVGAAEVAHARRELAAGAGETDRDPDRLDTWFVACLDVHERRDTALERLGNILGFMAAYILGPDPEGRGVPAALVPAVRELRATYSTHRARLDPDLVRRLGLFDYLRARLAVAGTPDDCAEQVRAAVAAGARQLMFTVSLAADPMRTVELFGRVVRPALGV
jgi:5,10-methylenetetrahydromethanopterin reductase